MAKRAQHQQARAKWAWDAVSAVLPTDDTYIREATKLPARLLTSGLGQTMAYLHAKAGEDRYRGIGLLYAQLGERLQASLPGTRKPTAPRVAMEIIVDLGIQDYRLLSREMLASAEWLKRFAEGLKPARDNERRPA